MDTIMMLLMFIAISPFVISGMIRFVIWIDSKDPRSQRLRESFNRRLQQFEAECKK